VADAPCSPPVAARAGRVSAPDAPVAPCVGVTGTGDADRPGASLGFPRQARLLDGAAYAPVFRRNQRVADHYWTVLVHDSRTGDAKLGLAIAKKRAKRAVDRNRLKRIARDSFRQHRAALGSRHIVIMNRDAATRASKAELRAGIDRLWRQIIDRRIGR